MTPVASDHLPVTTRIDRKQPCENRTIFSNAIDALQLIPHAYADDTQIYGFCRPANSADLCEIVSVCVDEVSAWMASNRLQLNHAKTDVLWCTSSRRQHQIPSGPVPIGTTDVQPVSSTRNLGVCIYAVSLTSTLLLTYLLTEC